MTEDGIEVASIEADASDGTGLDAEAMEVLAAEEQRAIDELRRAELARATSILEMDAQTLAPLIVTAADSGRWPDEFNAIGRAEVIRLARAITELTTRTTELEAAVASRRARPMKCSVPPVPDELVPALIAATLPGVRPARPDYVDDAGMAHPSPTSPGYASHRATCVTCRAERP